MSFCSNLTLAHLTHHKRLVYLVNINTVVINREGRVKCHA